MTIRVTPSELRAGADKIDAEKAVVAGITVPDESAAKAGLEGFVTAAKLSAADDAVKSALKIVGGRDEIMANLLRNTGNTFELVSSTLAPGLLTPPWMSQQVATGLTGMGDINLSRK
ncbi:MULTISPECIES: hypothetical protein [Mycobacteroides]|jgi:hypothetical protein|uniref:hypothetical protein n=1 Tax=Mycobacteroides TaxID=670516 RepID=UPI0007131124|nr:MULTISPECIES: hypothetical protein [Mycobacteroides]AMW17994.1 hypothetical protein Chelonae_p0243 [Mycobacterium sp. QIA-37]KRQ29917.1 hypothetical protein AOT86_04275 [Mycobacteroides sp. H072]KRQ41394.1 hypothetical protein AOT84_02200 [Mycobacteroides sp. H002]KRQ46020.1 hypothetical protein AOT85_24370 [Mycobacteroides sp. H054]KRQ70303.1 hypothetical protein AOT83_10775 [Mycobacteroides sp. H001]